MTALMMSRLRADTRPAHDALDRALNLDELTASPERYRELLARMYGFHAPLEPRLQRALRGIVTLRGRSSLLAEDLSRLGLDDLDGIARCADLPPLSEPTVALGVAYVLEGSALGGQVVARVVRDRLGLGADSGVAFFSSRGRHVGVEWRAFGHACDAYLEAHGGGDRGVEGAEATFAAMHRWLAQGGLA